ncbi:MAG: bidirectional hydrogenase complex protein HoxE [bacterium]|nr:bidirectional hydrogenase complex protein HoxE [Candidatus Sumerlaeota bacterium]
MPALLGKPTMPSDDKRWRIVDATMRRNGYRQSALIETLHTLQETFGFLEEQGLRFVAQSLRIPVSMVYGVATFYNYFTLKPQGEHTCIVCTGTACYIKGAAALLSSIEGRFGINPGETTADMKLSVLTARCFGCCGLAPAAVIDRETAGKLTPSDIMDRLDRRISA